MHLGLGLGLTIKLPTETLCNYYTHVHVHVTSSSSSGPTFSSRHYKTNEGATNSDIIKNFQWVIITHTVAIRNSVFIRKYEVI